jgi:cellulose biosynthesis protein BcsQ
LELPDHYPITAEVHGATPRRFISRLKKIGRAHKDDFIGSSALSHSADLRQFISQLKKIGRAHKHDFIVIDTPGGVQHLSLIVHGMADTLITQINDSLVDLDVSVAMEYTPPLALATLNAASRRASSAAPNRFGVYGRLRL